MNITALKMRRPTEPGEYWMRKPGMKKLLRVELNFKSGKLFISGEPAYGHLPIIVDDYPIEECDSSTEWMTVEEAGEI